MNCKHDTVECECVRETPHANWYEPATKAAGHWPQIYLVVNRTTSTVLYAASTEEEAARVFQYEQETSQDVIDIQDLTIDCHPGVSNWL